MREIARALFLFHAKGLLQQYGPSVGLKDGDGEKILAEPTKPEHERLLKQIIDGTPGPEILGRMGHVIEHAVHHTQPVRRFLSSTLFGKDWGIVMGAKNPVSYYSLIYGNPTFSLRGLWNGGHSLVKNVKSRWFGIAAGAALGFALLGPGAPLGYAAAGIAGGKFWGKPPPAAPASPSGGGVAAAPH
jgi:hypothetical protein